MTKIKEKLFLAVNAVFLALIAATCALYCVYGTIYAKAAASGTFFLLALFNTVLALVRGKSGYPLCKYWLLGGLALAFAGDIALEYEFIAGVVLFALGHVLLLGAFHTLKPLGWLNYKDAWYYMEDSGRMVTGDVQINGVPCHFDSSGALVSEGVETEVLDMGFSFAPYVTSPMCEAGYWNALFDASDDLLLTPDQISQLNQRIAETPAANVTDLAALPETFDGPALTAAMAAFTSPSGLYLNGQPVPEEYYEAIRANIRDAAVWADMPLQYGFAVNHTLMKAHPYGDALSDSPDDPEWDDLASSSVYVNEPLAVYFFTADGKYAYVRSAVCPGWVPAEDVAVCQSKAEWLDAQNMSQVLVVTGEKVRLEGSLAYPESSQKMLSMGTVLELVSKPDTLVNDRMSWYNYVVKLPQRAEDGTFVQRLALIPANRDVSVGYLPFTSGNILDQAFKSLGNRYGWGGMLDSQDCSSYVRDVYRCFGLNIPRNTTWQSAMPVQITSLASMDTAAKEAFLRTLTPGAILQFPGHEMLYLGEAGGRFYTLNDVSSLLSPLDPDGTRAKLRIRSVILNDLSTLRANGDTWLEQLTSAIEVWK